MANKKKEPIVPRAYVAENKAYVEYIKTWYRNYNPIIFPCEVLGKEYILEAFKELKDKIEYPYILQMERVDLDFIKKAHDIIGDKLRIAPTHGQEKRLLRFHDALYYHAWQYPEYTYEEILEKEKRFDLYTKATEDYIDKDGDIKSLSPLEKFIAAWTIATRIALYKNEEGYPNDLTHYHTSRSIYEIVGKNENISIVCVGFVRVLRELLYRMGLKDTVEISFRKEGDEYGHLVMLIHLVDPKYGIDGIYLSDPTQDADKPVDSRYSSMLMSRQLTESAFIHEYDFDFNKETGYNGKKKWKMYGKLDVENPDELYRRPIPKDKIVYARLALELFLDKNRKMVKDISEYNLLDVIQTSVRLRSDYSNIIQRLDVDKIYQDGIIFNFKELADYYPDIIYFFLTILGTEFRKEMKIGSSVSVLKDEEEANLFRIFIKLPKAEKEIADELKNIWSSTYVDMFGQTAFSIYTFDDRPIMDQLDDIKKMYAKFESDYSKIAREKKRNGVK